MTSSCLLFPNSSRYLHMSLIVENRFSTMVNACVPLFFSFLLLSRRTEPIFTLALLLPPEPCLILKESHHLPLHSASLSAPCGPSLPFIRLLPCRKRLVSLVKLKSWGLGLSRNAFEKGIVISSLLSSNWDLS